ncbi:A disintegrin and metalloproteinase with thrombospondin motifs 18-like [Liolophura sinensis]|uniref:A disintegrin and metalloproteinase with thrombospondin motifs 18-like n=1 Tax=Liolophura sinensis TaxID=3198878 RepID=UPI0031593D09
MLRQLPTFIILACLLPGVNGRNSDAEYLEEGGFDAGRDDIVEAGDFILEDPDDMNDIDAELEILPADISHPDIISTVISEIESFRDQTNSQSDVDRENALAEVDLAAKLLEMEEADRDSRAHVFSLENGIIREEMLPELSEEDDDGELSGEFNNINDDLELEDDNDDYDLADEDLNSGENSGIEALLTSPSHFIEPDYDIVVNKRYGRGLPAIVDILAVLDYSLYRKFLERHGNNKMKTMRGIRKYYTIMVAMANERYSTIRVPGMAIQLVLTNIVVSNDPSDSSWVESIVQFKNKKPVVSGVTALKKFQKWLVKNKDLPSYDHAIAFTGYDMLVHRASPASGLAHLAGMCNTALGLSSSIIVDHADYRSAYVIAHELGHSLGASHDGQGKNHRCPVSHNYVMSPKAVYAKSTFKNIYTFSTCSLTQMRTFLRSPAATCLYNKATPLSNYDISKTPPGQLFSGDAQCKMVFGKRSGLCGEPSLQKTMCERLWCAVPEDRTRCRTNDLLYALPGTACGLNKHCDRLACVTSQSVILRPVASSKWSSSKPSSPSGVKNSSPFKGRQQARHRPRYRSLKGRCRDRKIRQCDAVIRAKPSLCRRRRVQRSCCQACRRYYTPS